MLKYILVLASLMFGANSFAAGEALTEECLQRVASQAALVRNSAIAVIRGERIAQHRLKGSKQVPVDVQVFNDAHDLLAALPHLAEPEVLEERQLLVLEAICESPSFEASALEPLIESLPLPL
jgi:hypothetical protein